MNLVARGKGLCHCHIESNTVLPVLLLFASFEAYYLSNPVLNSYMHNQSSLQTFKTDAAIIIPIFQLRKIGAQEILENLVKVIRGL